MDTSPQQTQKWPRGTGTWKYAAAATAPKSLQSCLTLCNPKDGSPPGSPSLGFSRQVNTGVGCHFLLQCMKVKSESEVDQSCLTLSDPMDCSLPGSSIHGIWKIPGVAQSRTRLKWLSSSSSSDLVNSSLWNCFYNINGQVLVVTQVTKCHADFTLGCSGLWHLPQLDFTSSK